MIAKLAQKALLGAAGSALAAAGVLGSVAPAMAQTDEASGPEIIIVTATKRAQSLYDVPFSINAQTEEDIQRTGSGDLEDVARNVASLSIQNLGPGQSQVSVRGVSAGQVVRDQPGVKEQVGVYLDESVISLSLFTPDIDLYDLNRVETLRGPQGTLFGSGSVGGTVRYITNQPELDVYEGSLEASVNTITDGGVGGHIKGMVNAPLGDKAALRAVAYHTEYGGFIDARREGGGVDEDVNSGNRTGARVAVTLEPTDNITVTPRVLYQEIQADGFNRQEVYNLYANPFTTTRPPVQLGEREQHLLLSEEFTDETMIADVTAEIEFEKVTLTSVTSYIDRDILVSRDASALTNSVSIDLGFAPADQAIPSNLRDTTELKQFSQEARIASNEGWAFDWLLGVFYTDIERTYRQRLPTPGYDAATDAALGAGTAASVNLAGFPTDSPYNSNLPYEIQQLAFFGEATFPILEKLDFTFGGRWYDFEEERSFETSGLFSNLDSRTDTTESSGFTPRFILSYELDEDITINAQASQGFRLGGVNDPLNLPLCSPGDAAIFGGFQDYDDETLWNYEIDAKGAKGGITFTAAAFYTEIDNLQTTLDAGTCSSRIVFNVPEAHTAGVEFELGANPVEGLDVSVAASFIEAEFDSTVTDASGNVIGGIEEGNRLASVPEVQAAATATYSWPVNLRGGEAEMFLSGTVQYVGDRFTQPGDQVNNPRAFVSNLPFGGAPGTDATVVDLNLEEYTLLNVSAGVAQGPWEAVLYVNNVTDENANLSFDRERGGRARLGFRTNQPRTIGLTLRRSF